MKLKERLTVSRDELARLLLDMAKVILEKNRVEARGLSADLPDIFDLELELKQKNGRNKFEIEIVWEPEPAASALDPMAHALAPMPPAIIPSSFKALKKEMDRRLQAMGRMLEADGLPSAQEAEYFAALADAFRRRAKSEWAVGAGAVLREAERVKSALAAADRAEAEAAVNQLVKLRDDYHRQFK